MKHHSLMGFFLLAALACPAVSGEPFFQELDQLRDSPRASFHDLLWADDDNTLIGLNRHSFDSESAPSVRMVEWAVDAVTGEATVRRVWSENDPVIEYLTQAHLVMSPDSRFFYALGIQERSDQLAVVERDPATGELELLQVIAITGATDVALSETAASRLLLSPDESFLYVAAANLHVFARQDDGRLSPVQEIPVDTVERVGLSPDGTVLLAVGDPALQSYMRDASTGMLSAIAGWDEETVNGVLISTADELLIFDDGDVWVRAPGPGIFETPEYFGLRRIGTGLFEATGYQRAFENFDSDAHRLLLDGYELYFVGVEYNGVSGWLERLRFDPDTQNLEYIDGVGSTILAYPMAFPWGVTLSPDRRFAYLSGHNQEALARFELSDPAALEPVTDTRGFVSDARAVTTVAGSRDVYITAWGGISHYRRERDHLELQGVLSPETTDDNFPQIGDVYALDFLDEGLGVARLDFSLRFVVRDPLTGALSWGDGVSLGFDYPTAGNLVLSPDGSHVYSFGSLESTTGFAVSGAVLEPVDMPTELELETLVLTPDGRFGYGSESSGSDRTHLLVRDTNTGTLQNVDNPVDLSLFDGLVNVDVSPDGRQAYVLRQTSEDEPLRLDVLQRDSELHRHELVQSMVTALTGESAMTLDGDGRYLYAASTGSGVLEVYAREPNAGTLTVVDAGELGALDDVLGGGRALHLATSSSSNELYVLNQDLSRVAVLTRPCTEALGQELCVDDHRFRVEIQWQDAGGLRGMARPVAQAQTARDCCGSSRRTIGSCW